MSSYRRTHLCGATSKPGSQARRRGHRRTSWARCCCCARRRATGSTGRRSAWTAAGSCGSDLVSALVSSTQAGSRMKPAPFAYDDPTTVAEAVAILSRHGDEAKVLAGGQSLVPMLALRLARFERLVDLNRIAELQAIERVDGKVRIGSMVRQSVAERDTSIATDAPLLARALPHIG